MKISLTEQVRRLNKSVDGTSALIESADGTIADGMNKYRIYKINRRVGKNDGESHEKTTGEPGGRINRESRGLIDRRTDIPAKILLKIA